MGESGGLSRYWFCANDPVDLIDVLGLNQANYDRLKNLEGTPCCQKACTVTLRVTHRSIAYIRTPEEFRAFAEATVASTSGDCDSSQADMTWSTCCHDSTRQNADGPLQNDGGRLRCPCLARIPTSSVCAGLVRYFYLSCVNNKLKLELAEAAPGYQFDFIYFGHREAKAWFMSGGNTQQVYP
jgi:hypothetical protein